MLLEIKPFGVPVPPSPCCWFLSLGECIFHVWICILWVSDYDCCLKKQTCLTDRMAPVLHQGLFLCLYILWSPWTGSSSLWGSSLAGIRKETVKCISGKINTRQGVLQMEVGYTVHFVLWLTIFWEDCGLQTHPANIIARRREKCPNWMLFK